MLVCLEEQTLNQIFILITLQVKHLDCVLWKMLTGNPILNKLIACIESSIVSPCLIEEDTVPFENQSDHRSLSFEGKLI